MKKNLFLMLILMMMGIMTAQADGQLAFPGADGYGKYVTGGRGGKVYYVTRTDDCRDDELVVGTLRWALRTGDDSPRIILFQTSGTIYLTSKLKFAHPNVSILGQTAPGGGICIAGYNMYICKDNVIIRHLRFRAGDIPGTSMTGLDMENAKNVIIDHCSMTWSMEESLTAYDTRNTTVQWCIIGEALYNSKNDKGARAYAMQWGGERSTMHHTLITNSHSRSPRFNGVRSRSTTKGAHDYQVDSEFANNVVFNGGKAYGGEYAKSVVEVPGTWTDTDPGYNRVYMINNYYKPGPCTKGEAYTKFVQADSPYGEWYLSGNKFEVGDWQTATLTARNNDNFYNFDAPAQYRMTSIPYELSGLTYDSADDAYQSVVTKAGASLPRYDEVDRRLLDEAAGIIEPKYVGASLAEKNQYGIIDSPDDITLAEHDTYMAEGKEYTNYPFLGMREGDKYMVDTDADGMPDAYEEANGFNKNDASDGATIATNGYTNLENYLNGVADGLLNKADYETSNVMIPAGDAADTPTSATVRFSTDGAYGNAPSDQVVAYGANILLPSGNTEIYKEGYTMTGWKAGSTRYAFGSIYVAAHDVTLVPDFTANTETMASRTESKTITWDMTADNAPALGTAKGAYVVKFMPKTKEIDMGLIYDGASITVPSEKGAIITVNGATNQQFTAETDASTYTFTLEGNPADVTSVNVQLPAPLISGDASATWALTTGDGWTSCGTANPELAGSPSASNGSGVTVLAGTTRFNKAAMTTLSTTANYSTRSSENALSFVFTPANGMEFTPQTLTFRASQTGANAKMDIAVKQGDGTEKVIAEGVVPGTATARAGDVSSLEYSLSAACVKSDAPVTVTIYVCGMGSADKLGINALNIIGKYEGRVITAVDNIMTTPVKVIPVKAVKFLENNKLIIKSKQGTYTLGGAQK